MSEHEMTLATGGDGGRPPAEERVVGGRYAGAHHILLYFVGAVAAVWLLWGFYQVKVGQVAIVERLGQYIATPAGKAIEMGPGLHWHLPWPIDRVQVISTQQVLTMTVKTFNVSPAEYDEFKRQYLKNSANPQGDQRVIDALFNPYLISADQSVLHMEATVQFQVSDPQQWLMAVSHDYHTTYDPAAKTDLRNEVFQHVVERAMIALCSQMTFDKLLLGNRETLPGTLQSLVEQGIRLETKNPTDSRKREEINLGIEIKAVQVKLRPPDAVMPAYNNVLTQLASRDTKQSAAEAQRATMITKAQGEKQTLIVDAETYRTTMVQAANGEASRFSEVLKQYENTPDVTRWNLFVDAATAVTGNAKRIFFAQPGQKIWVEVEPPQYDANQTRTTQP
jgi:modulator of FtsH protease HflK